MYSLLSISGLIILSLFLLGTKNNHLAYNILQYTLNLLNMNRSDFDASSVLTRNYRAKRRFAVDTVDHTLSKPECLVDSKIIVAPRKVIPVDFDMKYYSRKVRTKQRNVERRPNLFSRLPSRDVVEEVVVANPQESSPVTSTSVIANIAHVKEMANNLGDKEDDIDRTDSGSFCDSACETKAW